MFVLPFIYLSSAMLSQNHLAGKSGKRNFSSEFFSVKCFFFLINFRSKFKVVCPKFVLQKLRSNFYDFANLRAMKQKDLRD